jgi:osmotically-inducible protein OsmY
MRSDSEIKKDVEDELQWDPFIDATDVAVAVKDGVVTLTGYASSYLHKLDAEKDAKRVVGVVGIANDIEVRLPFVDQRPDPEIARDAVAEIQTELPYSAQSIQVIVKGGWVTLEGNLEWNFQRRAAQNAVEGVRGVVGISNNIKLRPRAMPTEIKRKIEEALKRSAEIDADRITVETDGDEVTLRGTVRSWAERSEAERAAWAAPGVTKVENRISVSV